VNNVGVEFVIDTGADVTVVTEETGSRLGLRWEQPKRAVVGASGTTMDIAGQAYACIESDNAVSDGRIVVARDAEVNLLGRPQIRDLRLLRRVGQGHVCETCPRTCVSMVRRIREVSGLPVVRQNVTGPERRTFSGWLGRRWKSSSQTTAVDSGAIGRKTVRFLDQQAAQPI
jgi:predicted aspartyl protease